jgi:uncharacterized glyoxalase superfamily protein PhnB
MAQLTRIAPELPVADLPKALQHYQEKLGFSVAMLMPHGDYAIVERGDLAVHLFPDETRSHSPVGIHIFTTEIEALFDELKQSGAQVTQEITLKPWGNREFRVIDDFGNQIKFTEPLEEQ